MKDAKAFHQEYKAKLAQALKAATGPKAKMIVRATHQHEMYVAGEKEAFARDQAEHEQTVAIAVAELADTLAGIEADFAAEGK